MRTKILSFIVALATPFCAFASLTLSPLQQLHYEDLLLSGIIKSKSGYLACFKSVDGTIFVAKKGDYIGKQFGRIVEVTPNGIKISEPYELNFGEIYERKFSWPIVSNAKFRHPCKIPSAKE